MNVGGFHPKVGSKMFYNRYTRVRILLEVILETSDNVRSHLMALWDILI